MKYLFFCCIDSYSYYSHDFNAILDDVILWSNNKFN
jgi:hypothetical protein